MFLFYYFLFLFVVGLLLLGYSIGQVKLKRVQPALANIADPFKSHRAKHLYRGYYLLGSALIKLAALMVAGFLAIFAGDTDEEKTNETIWYGGCLWHRDVTGAWYSYSADDDTPSPPLF